MRTGKLLAPTLLIAAVTVAWCGAMLLASGDVQLKEDPPPADPPKKGKLAGRFKPAERVARLTAVSRVTGKTWRPTRFDRGTGGFEFADLPGDATYDLCADTKDGRRIEGIDLEFVDARLIRLAAERRKQLGVEPERSHEFSPDDARRIIEFIRDVKEFVEIKRVLYVRGHGRRATVLLERMRTRQFYASAGTIVWRVELWYFENQFGGWDKLANQERVLRRERLRPDDWRKIDVTYYPRLSARIRPDGSSDPVAFTVPDASDPSRGRPAGTAPELDTAPHILGLDVRAPGESTTCPSPASTRPAGRTGPENDAPPADR